MPDHGLGRKLLLHSLAALGSHLRAQRRISKEPVDCRGQRLRVVGGHDQPRLPIPVHVGCACAQFGADYRHAAGHGFELHNAQGFGAVGGGQHKEFGGITRGQTLSFRTFTKK